MIRTNCSNCGSRIRDGHTVDCTRSLKTEASAPVREPVIEAPPVMVEFGVLRGRYPYVHSTATEAGFFKSFRGMAGRGKEAKAEFGKIMKALKQGQTINLFGVDVRLAQNASA